MQSNQALDTIIKPVLSEMDRYGTYNTYDNRMLLLVTYSVNSFELNKFNCLEVARCWSEWPHMTEVARKISNIYDFGHASLATECEINKRLACLIVMGKYSLYKKRLPSFDDKRGIFDCYKKVFNSDINYGEWCAVWTKCELDEVEV